MSFLSSTTVRVACVKGIYSWCGIRYFGERGESVPMTPLSVLSAARA